MPTYGGDEVSAVVLDIGSNTTRAGYAGEDTPKVVIPTSFGYIPEEGDSNDQNDRSKVEEEKKKSFYFGDHGPTIWRSKMEVVNPLKDSIVQDWSATENLMNVIFDREMRLGLPGAELEPNEKRGILTEHPLLVTEASWNSKENRERMIELAFEKFDTPAYYSVDRAVMSAFASGKGTALVVDIGEELTTVTPVCDGFVLRKGIQKSPIAGKLISSVLLLEAEKQLSQPIYPNYLIASKPNKNPQNTLNPTNNGTNNNTTTANNNNGTGNGNDNDTVMNNTVDESAPEGLVFRDERMPGSSLTTESFSDYQKMGVVQELKETVCEVFPRGWDEESINSTPTRTFEFPTGQIQNYGRTRFLASELIFNPSLIPNELINYSSSKHPSSTIPTLDLNSSINSSATTPTNSISLPRLIMRSISSCDVDVQGQLGLNIIVTGGSSLIQGMIERLEFELKMIMPGMKFKISGTGNLIERRFSSWLGGSVLASLGSFHQLWIGKDEYKEQGRTVVHRRCK